MKVLVTAGSRHGSTKEIGQEIAAQVRASGHDCEFVNPNDVTSIEEYDAVVIGSAIYVGQWMKEAKDFIERFQDDLTERKVWLFSSGLSDTPSKEANSTPALLSRMGAVGATEHKRFAGKLVVIQLSVAERAAIMAARGKYGDARDMAAVRRWANRIATALSTTQVA